MKSCFFPALAVRCARCSKPANQAVASQVDAAMVDGVVAISSVVHPMRHNGFWSAQPERNLFANSSPF